MIFQIFSNGEPLLGSVWMQNGNCVVCECFGRNVPGDGRVLKFIVAAGKMGTVHTFVCADHAFFDTVCVDVREPKSVAFRRDENAASCGLSFWAQSISYENYAVYGRKYPDIKAPYTDKSAWNASTPPGFELVDNCAMSGAMMQEAERLARS